MKLLKGFTLIELLVVLGILGILAAALLAVINPVAQLQKSADAHRKADLESLQRALELFYQDNGNYPASSGTYHIEDVNGNPLNWGSSWQTNGQTYMNELPKDPVSTQNYVYYSTGQAYYLYAHLERGAGDPDVCNKGNACTNVPNGVTCSTGGAVCNYGVSSPNVTP
jgi:general secretion pathway protein G